MSGKAIPIENRFWDKVHKTGDCWIWTAQKDHSGYGVTDSKKDGKRTRKQAHRVAYELTIGRIPEGLVLDHLCRNPPCVNPRHLEPVPQAINVYRGDSPTAKNRIKTHCSRGHEFTTENTYKSRWGRQCRTCNKAREYERNKHRNPKIYKRICPICLEEKPMTKHQIFCSPRCQILNRDQRRRLRKHENALTVLRGL